MSQNMNKIGPQASQLNVNNTQQSQQPQQNPPAKEPPKEDKDKAKKEEKEEKKVDDLDKEEDLYKPMKRGNYTVHVLVEKLMNLKKVGDENNKMLPMVSVTCFDKTLRTQKLKNEVFDYDFEEHFYFSGTDKSPELMDSEKIIIKVHNITDKNKLNYLGTYQYDMQRIYNKAKDHCVHNQWIGLFNYENDSASGINGFLRISINIAHESDNKVALIVKEESKNKANLILPPQLRQNMSFHQLAFYFYEAVNIPNMDEDISQYVSSNDELKMFQIKEKACNAYVKIEYGEFIYTTKVVDTKLNRVIWDEVIRFPIPEPRVSDKVFIRLYDKDIKNDELIGTFELSLDDVIPDVTHNQSKPFVNKYENPKKIHFYGSDPSKSKSANIADMMNNNAEIGMMYKGTITVKVLKEENPGRPIKKKEDFERKLNEIFKNNSDSWFFKLRFYNLYTFNESHKDDTKIKVYFTIGQYGRSIEGKVKNRIVSFSNTSREYMSLSLDVPKINNHIENLPDIFVYLFVNETRISFQRLSCKDFMRIRKLCYLKLLPDVFNKRESAIYKGGLLKFSLRIYDEEKDKKNVNNTGDKSQPVPVAPAQQAPKERKVRRVDENSAMRVAGDIMTTDEDEEEMKYRIESKKTKTPEQIEREKKKIFSKYTVIFNIFQTKDLMVVDSKGTNDPYVEISYQNRNNKSKNMKNLINSVFNESIIFENVEFDPLNIHTHPIFLLKVFDSNTYSTNELIGFSYLSLCNFQYEINSFDKGKSKYVQLDHPKNCEQSSGEVLISMNVFTFTMEEMKKSNNQILKVSQETEKYCIELNAIALRDLKSTGFTNSKKPYIVFDLSSVDVKQSQSTSGLGIIKTVNNEYGNNPTINQIYKIELDLPKTADNIPNLSCFVEDYFLRIFKEKLGSFEISLKDAFFETKQNFDLIEKKFNEFIKLYEFGSENYSTGNTNKIDLIHEDEINFNVKDTNLVIDTNYPDNKKLIKSNKSQNFIEFKDEDNVNVNEIKIKIKDDLVDVKNSINNNEDPKNQIEPQKPIDRPKDSALTRDELKTIFTAFCSLDKDDQKLFTKILDRLNCIHFEPFVQKIPRPGDEDKGKYPMIEDEIFREVPSDFYEKLGYRKIYSDIPTSVTYRRKFDRSLEESNNDFKLPFNEDEENKINSRLTKSLAKYILYQPNEKFEFKHPFKTEHLIRGKTQTEKNENAVFENIRDKSKFNFTIKKGAIIPDSTNKSNRHTLHNLSESDLHKFSKGQFKYLIRVYNYDMFTDHIKRLEKAKKYLEDDEKKNTTKNDNLATRLSIKDTSPLLEFKEEKSFDFNLMNNLLNSVPKKCKFLVEYENLSKKILNKKDVIVRVYILTLNGLANRDGFMEGEQGQSDPYVKVYLTNDDKDNFAQGDDKDHQDDKRDCNWFKFYDFNATMPGSGLLNIDVIDYDNAFSHDLIGKASIDIESRFFDMNWESLPEKPIEVIPIYHDEFEEPQGSVKLWVDIFDRKDSAKRNNPIFIKPRPPSKMEVRLVVWECEGLPNFDMESSDIFFNATIDQESQSTDVHFSSWNGTGSFNWRIVCPIEFDETTKREQNISVQAYDYDIFSKNDYIAQKTIVIKKLLDDCDKFDIPIKFNKKYFENYKKYYDSLINQENKNDIETLYNFIEFDAEDKFWITLDKGMNKQSIDSNSKEKVEEKNANLISDKYPYGRVLVSLEIYPTKLADACKVGLGRNEPNINPYLPPPVGRVQWTWNPYTLVCQFIPPKWRRKICMTICFLLCLAYLIFVIPYIILHLSGEVLNPFNYGKK